MSSQTFLLPDLGEGLTEAQLIRWLVEPGERIGVDAPVAEVETAKAAVEVPSPYGGVIETLHGTEGAVLKVGEPLISVADGEESGGEESGGGSGNVLIGYGTTAKPEPGHRGRRRPAVVSPVVRKLAREAGVPLDRIRGTGADGLITRADVEAAIGPRESATADARTGLGVRERIPLTGTRKAIAEALSRSREEIPEATVWVDVDATALLALRAELGGPGLLAFLARFTVAGLARYPALNSRVDERAGEIVHLDGVNLGIATQTEHGLLVPAVTAAHTRNARELDTAIREVVAAARAGSVHGTGSFTINNYGRFGVDGSAAIINHPEAAILGIGRILDRPWIVDGEVTARRITQLSLVFDHRVCDGETAAGFLRFIADAVESPVAALASL
ncbi:dihydrolipoamide acetyltransferase family protein [Sciscionella sediminilitoris]|uniref:dihydrolipoamide acetyltransferase family protein n=1 Tax=Sciscionella sediminilitoris TaxID=1445613 RepID=UPI0004DF3201|nr:dihydrolipoamide acetyltransferase family protein [Sciscionella sp. SE31]